MVVDPTPRNAVGSGVEAKLAKRTECSARPKLCSKDRRSTLDRNMMACMEEVMEEKPRHQQDHGVAPNVV